MTESSVQQRPRKPFPRCAFPYLPAVEISWPDGYGRTRTLRPSEGVSIAVAMDYTYQPMGSIRIALDNVGSEYYSAGSDGTKTITVARGVHEIFVDLLPPQIQEFTTFLKHPNSQAPSSMTVVFRERPKVWTRNEDHGRLLISSQQIREVIGPLVSLSKAVGVRVKISIPATVWAHDFIRTHGWVWDEYFSLKRSLDMREYDFVEVDRRLRKLTIASDAHDLLRGYCFFGKYCVRRGHPCSPPHTSEPAVSADAAAVAAAGLIVARPDARSDQPGFRASPKLDVIILWKR